MKNKRFFLKHAKSSAALVSLGIHAVIIIVSIFFVAVTIIQKDETHFEAKSINRPKMQLKKLQVPVNVKKKAPKPKLRKRIVVKTKINQNMPDIKLPEISGIKGGIGGGEGAGMGGSGIGFNMPEIEIFGIKGKGEKFFLVLNTENTMLTDEMGGIPAYTIIKNEMIRIIEQLPGAAVFNICVYKDNDYKILFPEMVAATDANAAKAKAWLDPLNSTENAARSGRYGLGTLGPGGTKKREDYRIGRFAEPIKPSNKVYSPNSWYNPVMIAMEQQADTVFLLTDGWGSHKTVVNHGASTDEWIANTAEGKRWNEKVQQATKLHKEENARRKAAGKEPKVLRSGRGPLVSEYFPGTPGPPRPKYYSYTPKEFAEAFALMRKQSQSNAGQTRSGLNKSNKSRFSFNVIHFVKQGAQPDAGTANRFNALTRLCRGDYESVAGLEEIESYITPEDIKAANERK